MLCMCSMPSLAGSPAAPDPGPGSAVVQELNRIIFHRIFAVWPLYICLSEDGSLLCSPRETRMWALRDSVSARQPLRLTAALK